LVSIDGAVVAAARAIPETIKSLGAIHVATAELLADAIDHVITDDRTMASVLEARGIAVRTTAPPAL
jgi:hypothetical protein